MSVFFVLEVPAIGSAIENRIDSVSTMDCGAASINGDSATEKYIDKPYGFSYCDSMRKIAHIFMILVIAAFAAGTVVHAANATTMSVKMTLAVIDGAVMSDCQDCTDGNGDMPSCDNVCISPILAVVPSSPPSLPLVEATTESPILQGMARRAGPPDPYPQRFIILS